VTSLPHEPSHHHHDRPYSVDTLLMSALQEFFGNSYWLRLWVVQEIMLAKYIHTICGNALLSWAKLQRFCSSRLKHTSPEVTRVVPSQMVWLAERALSARRFSFTSLLLTFSANGCENPRDKAYGVQGLVQDTEKAIIDYAKPVHAVFCDAAAAIFRGAS
jgi:hypothetical protein